MQAAYVQFQANLVRVRELDTLHAVLGGLLPSGFDLSDLVRMQIVMAVSALDHYVHEVVRLGMIETQAGRRTATLHFLNYPITIADAQQWIASPSSFAWFDQVVRRNHGWKSFQAADKVADAIRLIWDGKLWDGVGAALGKDPKSIKVQLDLIVDRRNKIAHEADLDPTVPNTRWPMSRADAVSSVDFIESVVVAIHKIVV